MARSCLPLWPLILFGILEPLALLVPPSNTSTATRIYKRYIDSKINNNPKKKDMGLHHRNNKCPHLLRRPSSPSHHREKRSRKRQQQLLPPTSPRSHLTNRQRIPPSRRPRNHLLLDNPQRNRQAISRRGGMCRCGTYLRRVRCCGTPVFWECYRLE